MWRWERNHGGVGTSSQSHSTQKSSISGVAVLVAFCSAHKALSTGVEILQELSNAAAADVPSYRGRFDAFRLIYSKLTLLFVVEMIVRMSSICEMKFWRAGIRW